MGIDKFYRKVVAPKFQGSGSFDAFSVGATELNTNSVIAAKVLSPSTDALNVSRHARGTYDVADGGAPGTHSTGITLPDNAIVTKAWVEVVTAGVRGSSGTIAFHIQAANDIYTATASHLSVGFKPGAQTGTSSAFTKLTAARTIVADVATATMSAGKFIVYAEYVVSE